MRINAKVFGSLARVICLRQADLSLRIVQILLKSANNKTQCNLKLFYSRIPEKGFEYKKEINNESVFHAPLQIFSFSITDPIFSTTSR